MAEDDYLYNSVIDITQDYLGPAANRFIDRQIVNHLAIKPGKLKSTDMDKLSEWLRVALSILTSDQQLINDYFSRLDELTLKASKSRRGK